ncbi:MAG: hypothetical protein R3B81_03550 [bacterium]
MTRLILVPLLLLLAAVPARSADYVWLADPEAGTQLLRLGPIDGWVGAEFRTRREDAAAFGIRETIVSPGLHLSTNGSIYHEKLLTFRLAGSTSLERYRVTGDEDRSSTRAFSDYDASIRLLDHKAVHALGFARDEESWVDSPFRGSYRARTRSLGSDVRFENGVVPIQVSWNRERRHEDYTTNERVQERDRFRVSASHSASISSIAASFRLVDTRQNFQPQDYRTEAADLTHTLRFGVESPSHLRSAVRWFNQYGSLRRRDFGVSEDWRARWTRDVETSVRYRFLDQTGSPAATTGDRPLIRSHRGDVGGEHTLYGSLTTSLGLWAGRRESFDRVTGDRTSIGHEEVRGGRLDFAYRRATPYGGLRLGVGWERARQDQTSQDRTRDVANESHVLADGNEPFLDEARVDVATIVVTDESGFTVFQEGADYTVSAIGDRVLLIRVPGGAIADGSTVLVDYRFEFSPDLEFDTRGRRFQFRFDSNRDVSVYYRYEKSEEDLVSGVADGFLEDQRHHLAGIRARRGAWSATEEYEVRRLIGSEFRTNRISVAWSPRRFGRHVLKVSGGHARSRFEERDRTQNLFHVTSHLSSHVARNTSLELEVTGRVERGSPDRDVPNSEVLGVRFLAHRQIRALALEAGAFWNESNRNDIEDSRVHFYFSARRSFRLGGGGA